MESLFKPSSVAIIGASRTPGKVGNTILKNIVESGFPGSILPINPKAKEILGIKCYPSLLEVPEKVDLGVVAVPAKVVPKIAEEAAKKNVKTLVIVSAGFKEIGHEGVQLENKVLDICKKNNIRVLGPNCLGIIDSFTPLNASFAARAPLKGKIAFLSQSGALGTAVLDWAFTEKMGFSKFVSLGNKADIDESDLLNYLAEDDQTKAILIYIEGVKDGERFLKSSQEITRKKPVIILKSGITDAGVRAVSSHTGSMTGSDLAFNVAFKQAGIIRVETAEELFDIAELFSTQSIPVGPNLLIVTNAGGPGILAADSCEKYGLNMAPISLEISEKLRKELPPESGFYNPIDVLGDADSDRYRFALETAMVSPDVHSVLTILTPQAMTEPEDTAEVLKKIKEKFPEKPILTAFLGGVAVEKASSILKDGGIANYPFPERAVKSLQTLVKYGEFLKTSQKHILQKFDVGYNKASNIFNKVIKSDRVTLTASEATEVLRAYGISAPLISLATTAEEAASIADSVGYPVAMKVESPQILHKTDLGGVRLNLGSAEEVRRSFYEIIGRAHVFAPNAIISGVNVHRMVPQGREMIIGVHRDITFGPLIMFGLGGIYVNFLRDVAFRLAPLSRESAYNMIMETKAYTLLRGIRGEKASDIDSVINTILRISQLVTDFKIINEMDINPLFVYESGKGCIALDVKITIGS